MITFDLLVVEAKNLATVARADNEFPCNLPSREAYRRQQFEDLMLTFANPCLFPGGEFYSGMKAVYSYYPFN